MRCRRLGFTRKQVSAKGRLVRIRGPGRRTIGCPLPKAGADPNLGHDEYGTPLFSAAGDGNLPVVRMLIEAGALPDPAHETGRTPLARAVYLGHAKVVEYLLRHGADPRLKDADGRSVLEAARFARQRGPEHRRIYEMVRAAYARLPKSGGTKLRRSSTWRRCFSHEPGSPCWARSTSNSTSHMRSSQPT